MSKKPTKNTSIPSETDWDRLDKMTDEEIDYSDIPPLREDFFANARLRMPAPKQAVTLRLDPDILSWFKAQGPGYQTRINAVLRLYVASQKNARRSHPPVP